MKKQRDIKKELDFHIKHNDYFETLSTSLSLISQNLNSENEEYKEILDNLVEELIYLKDNYKIQDK